MRRTEHTYIKSSSRINSKEFSILDLMLREHLQEEKAQSKETSARNLDPEYMELLVTKYAHFPFGFTTLVLTLHVHSIKGLLLGGHGTTTDTLCVSPHGLGRSIY